MCFTEERNSYGIEMTCGWDNENKMFIFVGSYSINFRENATKEVALACQSNP